MPKKLSREGLERPVYRTPVKKLDRGRLGNPLHFVPHRMDAYGRTLRSIPQGKPNWKKPIVRNRKKEKTFEEAKADALRERRKSDRDFEKLKSLMRKLHPPGSGLMRKVREAKKATRIA